MRWCANCSKRPCRMTGGRGPRPIGCWRSPNAGPISSAIRARSAGKKYMSVAKAFFDTNILLYMYGGSDPAKQAKAAELFNAQTRTARAVVSTQVVQEFYAVATRKLGMASEVAGRIVRSETGQGGGVIQCADAHGASGREYSGRAGVLCSRHSKAGHGERGGGPHRSQLAQSSPGYH